MAKIREYGRSMVSILDEANWLLQENERLKKLVKDLQQEIARQLDFCMQANCLEKHELEDK